MKLFRFPLLLAAALLALTVTVSAADVEPGTPYEPDDGMVWFSSTMAYDTEARDYAYPVGSSGVYVHASVADGMIVSEPVKLSGPTLIVYRNGELVEGSVSTISQPGEYVVMAEYGSTTPRLFTFTLVGKSSNRIYTYNLPAGMIVTAAARDGEPISFERYAVPMQTDGSYHLEYECLNTGVAYKLDVVVDRTPPELHFSGNIDDRNRVHSALTFSNMETDGTLRVTLDGQSLEVRVNADGTGELTQSGNYVITAFDAAGNSSVYTFTVLIYLNSSSVAFFAVLLAAVAAVVIYVLIKRRRLQIG